MEVAPAQANVPASQASQWTKRLIATVIFLFLLLASLLLLFRNHYHLEGAVLAIAAYACVGGIMPALALLVPEKSRPILVILFGVGSFMLYALVFWIFLRTKVE